VRSPAACVFEYILYFFCDDTLYSNSASRLVLLCQRVFEIKTERHERFVLVDGGISVEYSSRMNIWEDKRLSRRAWGYQEGKTFNAWIECFDGKSYRYNHMDFDEDLTDMLEFLSLFL